MGRISHLRRPSFTEFGRADLILLPDCLGYPSGVCIKACRLPRPAPTRPPAHPPGVRHTIALDYPHC
eukprot:COSAG01_NODE_27008_length_697_cov_0.829431_1_plen_66_part_10